MSQGITSIAHVHADARRNDLLAEAAHEQRLVEARRASRRSTLSVAATLRHHVGTALVAVGRKLQHAPVPVDQPAPLGSLRAAR